jgi:sRNA-binding protein
MVGRNQAMKPCEIDNKLATEKGRKALKRLTTIFPKAFKTGHNPRRPLKKGIHRDLKKALKERDEYMSVREQKAALTAYTRGRLYIQGLINNPQRFDLEGKPCGKVSSEDRLNAIKQQGIDEYNDMLSRVIKKQRRYRQWKQRKAKKRRNPQVQQNITK